MIQYINIPAPSTGGGFDLTLSQSVTRSVYLSGSATFTATTDTAGVTLTTADWYDNGKYIGSGLTLPYTSSYLLGDVEIKCVASDGTSAASGSFTHEVVGIIYDDVRPDWPDIKSLVSDGDEKIVIQSAVFETGSNFLGFRVQGAYTVDWGDGVTENFADDADCGHFYTSSDFPASSGSSRGYKVATATVTPQGGQQLTTFEFGPFDPPSPAVAGTVSTALDIRLAGGNFTNVRVEQDDHIPRPMLERVEFVGDGGTFVNAGFAIASNPALLYFRMPNPNATNLHLDADFASNNSLRACTIGDREYRQDVSSATGLNSTFSNNHSMYHYDGPSGSLSASSADSLQSCFANNYSLRNVGNMEFTSCTSNNATFQNCNNLVKIGNQTVNENGRANSDGKFAFPNSTSTVNMFKSCIQLSSDLFPPNLVFPSVTQADSMFQGCSSLEVFRPNPELIPSAIDMLSLFQSCQKLTTLGPLNTSANQRATTMFRFCNSLKTIESMSFASVGANSADLMLDDAFALVNTPVFDFNTATDLSDTFETSQMLHNVGAPLSMSMNNNTNCDDLFKNSTYIQHIYITGSNNVTNWNEAFRGCVNLVKLEANMSYTGASFTDTFVRADSLSVVDIPGISNNVDFSDCHSMTKEVLDGLFQSLATVSGKTIDVSGTVGASTCNTSIATSKGWTVTTS
jgi:hypothetical protein